MPQQALKYSDPKMDGRVRLSEEEKKQIPKDYLFYKSLRVVAELYKVDKRTIQFVIYPERLEQLKKIREGCWKKYYNKADRKEAMRKYRAKKRGYGLLINTTI